VRQCQVDWKTKKRIMKLVGTKPLLNCTLGKKEFKVLWDTGSMVSLVDRKWVVENFPDEQIHSVSEFLGEELHLRAANNSMIQFDGLILLDFGLKINNGEVERREDKEQGFVVPILVSSNDIVDPILGYNVIEHLILEGSPEQKLALEESLRSQKKGFDLGPLSALIQEKAEDPDFLTEVKMSKTITVPAGHRVQVKCRVKAESSDKEQAVYFAPVVEDDENELIFSETISKLKLGRTNHIIVDVMNLSTVDRVVSKGKVVGSVHGVSAVLPMTKMADVERRKKVVDVGSVDAVGGKGDGVGVDQAGGKVAWAMNEVLFGTGFASTGFAGFAGFANPELPPIASYCLLLPPIRLPPIASYCLLFANLQIGQNSLPLITCEKHDCSTNYFSENLDIICSS